MPHTSDAQPWLARLEVGVGLLVLLALLTAGGRLLAGWLGAAAAERELVACVADSGGLQAGAPVRIAGVRVGSVRAVRYDASARCARLSLGVDRRFALPADSALSIASEGLLGGRQVSIEPGSARASLGDGASVSVAHSALQIDALLRQGPP